MKWKNAVVLVALILMVNAAALSQSLLNESPPQQSLPLSGDLRIDVEYSKRVFHSRQDSLNMDPQPKSALLAAGMSLALPGAGEFYIDRYDYWRYGSFLAAEVGLWIIYASYESKGDDQTVVFEAFADQHWSVLKYAQWIEQYGLSLNENADPAKLMNLYNPNNPNAPPWERVYWDRLNDAESEIGKKTGTFFSHQLPLRPEQQYYELIGKYPQYNPGWDDASVDDQNFHTALTERFLAYSKMRGEANDFYTIARTAGQLLLLNRVLSALDAAWITGKYNKRITTEAHIVPVERGFGIVEFVPTMRVQVGL
ncbi:MAG: olfactomedin domain-containing protein [Ignavibacteriae bacterium]|nr:olfactomedin domain-containing protein [Ignavibacteriota bacterium]